MNRRDPGARAPPRPLAPDGACGWTSRTGYHEKGIADGALHDQLCGKYLRAREGRHGILLLVHQKPRHKGWRDHDGAMLSFNQVVERLQTLAIAIAASGFDAPQPEIAVLDVSSFNRT
jgi:hypothetical protein